MSSKLMRNIVEMNSSRVYEFKTHVKYRGNELMEGL